ncbi:MAG: hypothetical protein K9H58_05330 [Bacteroidales bacterium]|nr:hypothetical protein [Bacteroidales bacterium]
MIPLKNAKSIGIVYQVTNENTFKSIGRLVQTLAENNREVLVVGFVEGKEIPTYCVTANSGYYFNRQSVRWTHIPKNDYVNKFMDKEFDILFDLSEKDKLTIKYITGLSKAKLKVGRFSARNEKYLDMMIALKSTDSLDVLIDQSLFYLRTINSR